MIELKCPACRSGMASTELAICKIINCPVCNESLKAVSVEFKTLSQLNDSAARDAHLQAQRSAKQLAARQAEIARRLQESQAWVAKQGSLVRNGCFEYIVNGSMWVKCQQKEKLFLMVNITIENIDDETQPLPLIELVDQEANFYTCDYCSVNNQQQGLKPAGRVTLDVAFDVAFDVDTHGEFSLLLGDNVWPVTDYRAVALKPA